MDTGDGIMNRDSIKRRQILCMGVATVATPKPEEDGQGNNDGRGNRGERRGGVLYVNPGSVGPRRFSLPVAMAILKVGARVDVEPIVFG